LAAGVPASVRNALAHAGVRASLETASPYGEVSRFGGFAEGGVSGKFDVPVGFAVDSDDPSTSDHNAVYVLDRVVDEGGQLGYRLQKLSSSGVVLGTAILPVQTYGGYGEAHPMFGLAVDSAKHRVYALVENPIEVESEFVNAAYSLVAWSTEPKKEGSETKLVSAPGYTDTEPFTGAALVAGPQALRPEEAKDLIVPEGLAVNPNTHEVIIAAQAGPETVKGGPTTLQAVITEGANVGTRGPSWVANNTIAPNEERAAGVFTTKTGFGVDLYHAHSHISRLAEVNPTLTDAQPLAEDKSENTDLDQAPTVDARRTPNINGAHNSSTLQVYTAGTPITQLSNGLYAARYGRSSGTVFDTQSNVAPWTAEGAPFAPFWTDDNGGGVANMGVRLFTHEGRVVTTIGGQPQEQACNIDTEQMAIAAGANGSVFLLTQPNEERGETDDQVIEFAPGGTKGACPVPSIGKVNITQSGQAVETGLHGEYVVHQGAPVTLEAGEINRAGEAPYEFSWNFAGAGYTVESMMQGPDYLWPSPIVEHQYTAAEIGTHEAGVQMTGDYGTVTLPFKIAVLGSSKALAKFTMPSSITEGQSAAFNGAASEPTQGSEIVEYRWEFSDEPGHVHELGENETQEEHTFTKAGSYQVKLTIFDAVGGKSEIEQTVTVVAAPSHGCEVNCTTSTTTSSTTTGSTTGTTTTTTTTATTSTGPPKSETKAEKLAHARKACKRYKKKKRAACEAQARKKYGPPAKPKKKKKK
jgi:PKD repeat protein